MPNVQESASWYTPVTGDTKLRVYCEKLVTHSQTLRKYTEVLYIDLLFIVFGGMPQIKTHKTTQKDRARRAMRHLGIDEIHPFAICLTMTEYAATVHRLRCFY